MKQLIKSLQIVDFRSFDDKTIPLNGVTCLVGANESGKTNLLEAISLCQTGDIADAANKLTLKLQDTRKNSSRSDAQQLPLIRYTVSKTLVQHEWLSQQLETWKVNEITLVRDGNELAVELPELPEDIVLLKNATSVELPISPSFAVPSPSPSPDDETQSAEKPKKVKTKVETFTIAPSGYALLSSEAWEEYAKGTEQEVADNKLIVNRDAELKKEVEQLCLKEIKANLKVFFWSYDKEKYSLPEMITTDDVMNKWSERPVIRAIFKLGGYGVSDLKNLLTGRTETDYDNIFDKLSKKVTQQIRAKWSTNQKVEIQIRHKGDHLKISIAEPGYSIDPQYRSEGMRWFLAFVIGIISEADELKDHVILIDEPALHLHPGGQRDVLGEINRLGDDNQIIYSTHSHFMIDRRYPDRVLFLMKEESDEYFLTNFKKPTQQDIFRDPLLRAALLYSLSEVSYLNEKNVLVEGWFDKNVIEAVNNWLTKKDPQKSFNPNSVSVVDCNGAGRITQHAALYQANDLLCISVYDSDTVGESGRKGNKQQKDEEKIGLESIAGTENKFTMEDMLPEKAFQGAVARWEVKNDKVNGTLQKPRMKKHILPAIDEQQQPLTSATPPDQDAISLDRLRLKHQLEDLIVEELNKYLEAAEVNDPELANLISLIEKLANKTNPS